MVHQELTVPEIQQIYFEVKEKMKLELLSRLLDIHNFQLSLVFCNTKRRVDKLVTHLQIRGYAADGLHGDMVIINKVDIADAVGADQDKMVADVKELNPEAVVIKSSLKTGQGLDEIISTIEKFMFLKKQQTKASSRIRR